MRFKKIKITSDDKIKLQYEEMNKLGTWDSFSMTSAEQPVPNFLMALDNLIPHVEEMCELPDGDHQIHPYNVRGISFSYVGEKDTMGATITATRTLNRSNSPLILNSPHKISEPYADGADDTQLMTADCLIDIQQVIERAKDYLNGERAQTDLFTEDEPEFETA